MSNTQPPTDAARLLLRERALAYLQITVGCAIGALAYPLFLLPNSIAPGGLTGVATILHHLWGWPVGAVSMVMNLPLFFIGYRTMGRVFAFRSLVATVLFSVLIDLMPLPAMTSDPLLGAVFGGCLLGAGLGLILRGGATTGGTDMIARMVHHRFSFITVGAFLFFIDFLVVCAAGFCIGAASALYALITIYISARILDLVVEGFSRAKACYVVSDAGDLIARRLMDELSRGVTFLRATGAYTGKDRPVVMCVVGPQEVPRVKLIVQGEDPRAFLFITEAHEVLGEGFAKLTE